MLTAVTHSFHSVKGTESSAGVTMEFRGAFQCFEEEEKKKSSFEFVCTIFTQVQLRVVQ